MSSDEEIDIREVRSIKKPLAVKFTKKNLSEEEKKQINEKLKQKRMTAEEIDELSNIVLEQILRKHKGAGILPHPEPPPVHIPKETPKPEPMKIEPQPVAKPAYIPEPDPEEEMKFDRYGKFRANDISVRHKPSGPRKR